MADTDTPVLELRGITKRFPGVLANDHVDFDLRRGEVHALLGENGAGKSTLMNILYGLYRPDEGEILLNGKPADFTSPHGAIDAGIGMVHQHFMLIPVMTVAENIVLAAEPRRNGVLLDTAAAERRVRELADQFRFHIDPHARVQAITVLDIADRITVLRRGKKVDTIAREGATEEGLARMMVGREVLLRVDKQPAHPQAEALEVADLHVFDDRGLEAVRGVSFTVRAGEILAIAGVDGNGQTELIDAITGLRKPASGRVEVGGKDITGASAHAFLNSGIGHIPEDRQRRGLVLEFSLAENLVLHDYAKEPYSRWSFLNPQRVLDAARGLLKEFDVRGGSPTTRASALSGGNQQKVVLAREISRDPAVLIAAQPTRGLDVGAIEFVHRRLVEQRDAGKAVLLVSLELEEVLGLADRILVIYEGRIAGEFDPSVTEQELGIAMTGGRSEAAAV